MHGHERHPRFDDLACRFAHPHRGRARAPHRSWTGILRIQAFIFNWHPHEEQAAELERDIGKLVPVTVINSQERLSRPRDGWVHLDDSAYFSAQWNNALAAFEGDVLFHMQADARCDELERLLERATPLLARGDIGVYEPNVDFTVYRYDRSRLEKLGEQTFVVPITDQTCWLVTAGVLRDLPPVELHLNRYGWGISAAVAAVCRLQGKLCVRDYEIAVAHPKTRGYPSDVAAAQRDAYLASLGPAIAEEAARLYGLRSRVSAQRATARRSGQ
jgi:hypothetical protein